MPVKKIRQVFALISVVAGLFALVAFFQNCAQNQMEEIPSDTPSSLSTLGKSCSSSPPRNREEVACPDPGAEGYAYRSRTVQCQNGAWTVGMWSNLMFTHCGCGDPAATMDVNGFCQCPSGQNYVHGKCVVAQCPAATKPPSQQTQKCPSNIGNAVRSRHVYCPGGATAWQVGDFGSWDFTACGCSHEGAAPDLETGICSCPDGTEPKTVSGVKKCVTIPGTICTAGVKREISEQLACPSGIGRGRLTRTYECHSSGTKYEEVVSLRKRTYEGCLCPNEGELLNTDTGACACPSGQIVIGGKCSQPVCNPDTKPAEQRQKNCPSNIGQAVSRRTVSCSGAPDFAWQVGAYGAWDYAGCQCPDSRDYMNPTTGVCEPRPEVACQKLSNKTFTQTVVFSGGENCRWGLGGNLDPASGRVRARSTESQVLDLDRRALLCGIKINPRIGQFWYDDHFFFAYSGMIMAASQTALVNSLVEVKSSTGIRAYDWNRLKNRAFNDQSPPFCLGASSGSTCLIPSTEVRGSFEVKLAKPVVQTMSRAKAADAVHELNFITVGDNDDGDCRHKAFEVEVEVQYVEPWKR